MISQFLGLSPTLEEEKEEEEEEEEENTHVWGPPPEILMYALGCTLGSSSA